MGCSYGPGTEAAPGLARKMMAELAVASDEEDDWPLWPELHQAVIAACSEDNVDAAQLAAAAAAADNPADINTRTPAGTGRWAALHLCCANISNTQMAGAAVVVAKELLDSGADQRAQCANLFFPLHYAVANGLVHACCIVV